MKLKFNTSLSRGWMLMLLFTAIGHLAFSQSSISGKVTDGDNGEALIGASVIVAGTSTGTVTDIDGNYSLNLPDGTTEIEISYTVYATQKVALNGQKEVNVVLQPGSVLDEVVVVGYGTVKKRDLTGAVTSIKSEDFNQGIVTSPDQLIQGKVAGLQIINNSGAPGSSATVRIRGNSSIRTGSTPLYVVDGVPLDNRTARPDITAFSLGDSPTANPLNFLNTSDIASMEVLKDASATAIYGARGSNGVIIINTKKGIAGETSIDFNVSTGFSNILNNYDLLDAGSYRSALEQYDVEIDPDTGRRLGDLGGSSDAMDEILRTGVSQNYNFSVRGGSETAAYRFSAGYSDIQGIIKGTGLKRYTGNLGATYKFWDDRINLDVNLLASQVGENIAPIANNSGATGSLISQALQWNPTRDLYLENGELDIEEGATINPIGMLEAYDDKVKTTTILGSISPSVKLADGLVYKYLFSANQGLGERRLSIQPWINLQGIQDRGGAAVSNSSLSSIQHTHTLNYTTEVADGIDFGALAGYEYQKFDYKGSSMQGLGFLFADRDLTNFLGGVIPSDSNISSFHSPTSEIQSYFARANVAINDKYSVTATIRADGSTKFGENNKYGYFPSFAAAWNIANEDFISSSSIDQLKLRAGWGLTGNQEFPPAFSIEQWSVGNNGAVTTTSQNQGVNPDLQWESSSQTNIGLDFAFMNYRVSGSVDYFNRTTENLLFAVPAASPAPPNAVIFKNIDATVQNSGVELMLNTYLISNDKMNWNIGMNLSFLKNEVTKAPDFPIFTGALHGQGISGAFVQKVVEGEPLNSFWTREYLGLDAEGISMYANEEELGTHGSANPDILLGINTGFTMGKLSVGVNFTGAFGHKVYNNTQNTVVSVGNLGKGNIDANLIGGSQENLSNAIKHSTRYVENADFVRLSNMTVSYNLGDFGKIRGATVYLTGQNLLLFTDYTGFDPEVNTDKSVNSITSFGIEYAPYPSARSFIFGVNLSL